MLGKWYAMCALHELDAGEMHLNNNAGFVQ